MQDGHTFKLCEKCSKLPQCCGQPAPPRVVWVKFELSHWFVLGGRVVKVCGTRKQTGPDQVRIPVLLFFCSLGMFSTVSNLQHSATVTTKATKHKEGLNLLPNEFFFFSICMLLCLTSLLYRMLAVSNICYLFCRPTFYTNNAYKLPCFASTFKNIQFELHAIFYFHPSR